MKTKLLKSAIMAVLITMSTNLMAFTAVISGSWSNAATWGGVGPGATVSNNDIIIPSGLTVDLDVNTTFNGLINSFTVDGTLNSANNSSVSITAGTFAGAGTVNIHRLSLSGLLTSSSFSGNMNVFSFQDQGAAITLDALVNVTDTLDLDGGTLTLSSGSNLTMATNSNVRINNGSLVTLGGVFTTGNPYDAWYVGTAKTTGLEVNSSSLRNLNIGMNSNTEIVTQGMNNMVVNGNLNITSGELALNGNHLTLNGDFMQNVGTKLISTATSDLTINGTGTLSSPLNFSAGSSVHDFEINRTSSGNVSLATTLNNAGTLHLTNGTFTLVSGGTLVMVTGSDIQVGDGKLMQGSGLFVGTASYNVEYIGGAQTSGVELSGTGLDDVSVGLTSIASIVTLGGNVIINGNLDLMSGKLFLNGYSLELDSSFSQVPTALIMGDSASDLTLNLVTIPTDTIYFGAVQHLRNLTLNLPATSELLLATSLIIHNQLDMMSGKLEITNSNLILRSAAFINGFSDTKYIITSGSGQLQMNVNSNASFVTFPIGTAASYSPAQIQQTVSGSSGMFMVRAMDGVYTAGTSGFNSATIASVVNKTWMIDAAAGVTVNMNLKLGWLITAEVNGFNRNQSYISHYMNSAWDFHAYGAAASGLNNTYEMVRNGISSLSPFAVVDSSALMSTHNLALETSIGIYPNPSTDFVSVQTGAGHGNFLYEMYDATGQMVYSVSNSESVNKISLNGFANGLYFIRITDTTTQTVTVKRFIKE